MMNFMGAGTRGAAMNGKNLVKYLLVFLFIYLFRIPFIYADTTFFNDPDDSFIMGNSQTSQTASSGAGLGAERRIRAGVDGGITTENPGVFTETKWLYLYAGDKANLILNGNDDGMMFIEAEFEIAKGIWEPSIKLERKDTLDGDMNNFHEENGIYEIFEIALNEDLEEKGVIKNCIIEFFVEDSWNSHNGLNNEDINLFHYKKDNWEKLKTKFLKEEGNYYKYSADVSEFSYFIVGTDNMATTYQKETEKIQTQEKEIQTISLPKIEIAEKNKSTLFANMLLLIIIIIFISIILFKRKKR